MFCVQIAGVLVAIENRYAFTEQLCADYIVDASPDECDFSVSATAEEIAAENNDEDAFSPAYCESLALYRKMCTHLLNYDAFLFHAAVVSYAGRGYAFAAKSGTGKSTHVAQWMHALGDRVTVVNGDKPILRWRGGEGAGEGVDAGAAAVAARSGEDADGAAGAADAADDGSRAEGAGSTVSLADADGAGAIAGEGSRASGAFLAYGTPYCGKESWGQNTSVPLRTVCFIERCEPGELNRLERLEDDGEIINRMMNQVLLPKDPVLAVRQLDLLDRLVTSVPFYVLRCTPTRAAFDAAFQMTLCDNENE